MNTNVLSNLPSNVVERKIVYPYLENGKRIGVTFIFFTHTMYTVQSGVNATWKSSLECSLFQCCSKELIIVSPVGVQSPNRNGRGLYQRRLQRPTSVGYGWFLGRALFEWLHKKKKEKIASFSKVKQLMTLFQLRISANVTQL